jgi:hypothetical protein
VRAGESDTAQSRPIDLDDLTARLENIPPSPTLTEDLGDEEYYRLDLEQQRVVVESRSPAEFMIPTLQLLNMPDHSIVEWYDTAHEYSGGPFFDPKGKSTIQAPVC